MPSRARSARSSVSGVGRGRELRVVGSIRGVTQPFCASAASMLGPVAVGASADREPARPMRPPRASSRLRLGRGADQILDPGRAVGEVAP